MQKQQRFRAAYRVSSQIANERNLSADARVGRDDNSRKEIVNYHCT